MGLVGALILHIDIHRHRQTQAHINIGTRRDKGTQIYTQNSDYIDTVCYVLMIAISITLLKE